MFGVFCRRWGVPLIDGGTVRLPRLVGAGARARHDPHRPRRRRRRGAVVRPRQPASSTDGEALAAAVELAAAIAEFPQDCLRADRASAMGQWDLSLADALRVEGMRGYAVVAAEGLAGAARFAAGAGRHGKPAA